jgi:hypothetical protein
MSGNKFGSTLVQLTILQMHDFCSSSWLSATNCPLRNSQEKIWLFACSMSSILYQSGTTGSACACSVTRRCIPSIESESEKLSAEESARVDRDTSSPVVAWEDRRSKGSVSGSLGMLGFRDSCTPPADASAWAFSRASLIHLSFQVSTIASSAVSRSISSFGERPF